MIALRKNISKARGEQVLIEDIRYFFYITTRTDLTAAGVVACANERCDQENIIGQLKWVRLCRSDYAASGMTSLA